MKNKPKYLHILERHDPILPTLAHLPQQHTEHFLDDLGRLLVFVVAAHVARIHVYIYLSERTYRHGIIFDGLEVARHIYLLDAKRHPEDVADHFFEILAEVLDINPDFCIVICKYYVGLVRDLVLIIRACLILLFFGQTQFIPHASTQAVQFCYVFYLKQIEQTEKGRPTFTKGYQREFVGFF